MAIASNLGFPRIGAHRELKRAVEAYWDGKMDETALRRDAEQLKHGHWRQQQRLGLTHIPSNDFSFYDHVLDTAVMAGAVPHRFGAQAGSVSLDTYFAMARGTPSPRFRPGNETGRGRPSAAAMEMTKWFDTNYHYIVPEMERGQRFQLLSRKPVQEFLEARAIGVHTRPVLVGPVTFLLLSKSKDPTVRPLALLDDLLPIYEQVLSSLAQVGADWVQIDEPCLGLTLDDDTKAAYYHAYSRLALAAPSLKLLVAIYFSDLRDNADTALRLPVAGLHLDLVRGPSQLDAVLPHMRPGAHLSLGVVDGRNVWKADLARALATVRKAVDALGSDRVLVGPSCSLLHSPVDLTLETGLDADARSWMAFALQKVTEVVTLARAVNEGPGSVGLELAENASAVESRRTSSRIHNPEVARRLTAVRPAMLRRKSAYRERRKLQRAAMRLPAYPTTTIGSFPQTAEVRKARADLRRGAITQRQYEDFLREEIGRTIRFQEGLGLDVLVHGEFERNDMVEYFGEQLDGYLHTTNGWVQSYGTRCVKPPVIFGDIRRPKPMTVEWITYAQSLTERPVKGMLTGPVTMLQWSFVRDDQPRGETCKQLALAIRDEVKDLERAGIRAIQIDEPALREGLPLRSEDWAQYLRWAVDCFRLASSGVADSTQVHTHMCYAEFNDIIESIGELDADVISIEASRSGMELLKAFGHYHYPNQIGPGVYDIHSPRVPSAAEIRGLLGKAAGVLSRDQIWVNPDCGLKTRGWPEVEASLEHLVKAAQGLRKAAAPTVRAIRGARAAPAVRRKPAAKTARLVSRTGARARRATAVRRGE